MAVVYGLGASLTAQSPASPAFEVASIKLDKTSSPFDRGFDMPADRFEAIAVPLQHLIAVAYGEPGHPPRWLADYQIAGGPNWMNTDLFDIMAKAASDVPAGTAGERQKLLMLRTLLADRFKLVVHHETRQVPIYLLVLARNDGRLGPRLRRSDANCGAPITDRGGTSAPATVDQEPCMVQMGFGGSLMVRGQTIAAVADVLSHLADRLVTDRTGLSGTFDLDLQFSPEGLPGLVPPGGGPGGPPPGGRSPNSNAPSIFTAMQEQLGLKLESTRGPVDVLVIDRVEHPTEDR